MSHRPRSSLVQIIVIIWTNGVLLSIQLDPYKQASVKLYSQNSNIFIQENAFENVIWKMSAIMSQPQCANVTHLRRDPTQMSCLQSQGVLGGSPSRDAGFGMFGWVDGIASTLPYYHSTKHTFQSVNFPTKHGGFFDIVLSVCGGYSHPIHMLKSLKN